MSKDTARITWRDHVQNADQLTVLAEYADGSAVFLASHSGGLHQLGAWGELTLMKIDAQGKTLFREYQNSNGWKRPALKSETPDVDDLIGGAA
jgi:hypothetical protein